MRLDDLTIALRPRSPWEATDLGIALVRRHARVVWSAWAIVTIPVFVAASALGWWLDEIGLFSLLLWWLKPVFDRIPLYVLSRAVFGATPTVRETLRAQLTFGWGAMLPWLTWRRLHPGRALLLCVDLLEGVKGAQRSERARVLSRSHGSNNVMLTIIGLHLEMVLFFSLVSLGLMFVPIEFMSETAQATWETLFETPPRWAQLLTNLLYWLAVGVVEPCYVAAGFGLYLNRRTQLEAWDIEVAFRRIAARLAPAALGVVLLLALALPFAAPRAAGLVPDEQTRDELAAAESAESKEAKPLETIFSKQYRGDSKDFEQQVVKTYEADDLNPKRKVSTWKPRNPEKPAEKRRTDAPLGSIGTAIAFLAEFGLWILVGAAIGFLAYYRKAWLPWLALPGSVRAEDAIVVHEADAVPERLPDDVPAAVRALWADGAQRAALALLYRASVQRLAGALGAPLPNGATESDCLRHARKLGTDAYAPLFARIVRAWQGHAYAQRPVTREDVEALLTDWARDAPCGVVRMTRNAWIGLAVAVLAAVGIGIWWTRTYELVDTEIDMPLRGAARFNPMLALGRTLREQGLEVHTRSHLNVPSLKLAPGDVLVLAADVRALPEADATRITDWVSEGGHLIFAIPKGSSDGYAGELLTSYGIEPVEEMGCLRWEHEPKNDGIACFVQRFKVDTEVSGELDWTYGSEDTGYLFARQYDGEGSWLAAADLDFLTNRELDEPGKAALAWQILAPALDDGGKVHLVYAADVPPWYVLLARNGWPLIVPALVALLAWLWSRSQRFGPVLALAPADRRALLEHVNASGEFVFRRGRALVLYTALRRAFMERLRRRDPALAALHGEPLVQEVAARTRRPVADVRQALHPVDIGRPEKFLASMKTLTELRRDL